MPDHLGPLPEPVVLEAEVAFDAEASLGEGPVWDVNRGRLWWVDIDAGRIHMFDPMSGRDATFDVGEPVGSVALRTDRRLLVALPMRFAVLDAATGALDTVRQLPAEAVPRRANDGKCDPSGRFVVGRMGLDAAAGHGSLVRLEHDLSLAVLLAGLTIPNGLAWRSNGKELLFVDSSRREVLAYPYLPDLAPLGTPRRVVTLDGPGDPDGMTIDAEGGLWIAMWDGSRVVRIDAEGRLGLIVKLPVSRPTSCTFGGPGLRDLYITTARQGLSAAERRREPLAGSIFRVRPGVAGVEPDTFAT